MCAVTGLYLGGSPPSTAEGPIQVAAVPVAQLPLPAPLAALLEVTIGSALPDLGLEQLMGVPGHEAHRSSCLDRGTQESWIVACKTGSRGEVCDRLEGVLRLRGLVSRLERFLF